MSQKREKGKKRELIYWALSSIDENITQESVTSLHFQVEHVGHWVVFLGEASRQDVRDAWCGDEVEYCQIKPLPPSWKLLSKRDIWGWESLRTSNVSVCVHRHVSVVWILCTEKWSIFKFTAYDIIFYNCWQIRYFSLYKNSQLSSTLFAIKIIAKLKKVTHG